MSEPIIVFDKVSKIYTLYKNDQERFKALFVGGKKLKKHMALTDVSIKISKGESVGIIGDNGAGKSTMLKMITGVTFPTTGEIMVTGRVAALLELTAGFSPEMTGRENIYLKGYILGYDDKYMSKLEPDIIEFAELGDYIDQPVRTYSSGMRARLGFAINVNLKPDILVIDEALSVGDVSFRQKCQHKIQCIIKTGVTVLFVSHSANSVRDVCERCIFLKKGKVVFDGGTEEALQAYLDSKTKKPAKKVT